jgi:pyruvate dehydrogenase E2 component (dihydrolipoamide acetyltransferase)
VTAPLSDSGAIPLAELLAGFGELEHRPLSRIQAVTAKVVSINWHTIPHVTHQDRIDVTGLESARHDANAKRGSDHRLSPLPYLLKAVVGVLGRMPQFNAALDVANSTLLLRKYVHVGIAIDTPGGLVIGVIRECTERSVENLALEIKRLRDKASTKGLAIGDMTGAGFTISSLGNLGGDGFTPIINAPQVAILGIGRLADSPRRAADGGIEWRKLIPVSLSYDHRALNGVDAGTFMSALQSEVDRVAGALPSSTPGHHHDQLKEPS